MAIFHTFNLVNAIVARIKWSKFYFFMNKIFEAKIISYNLTNSSFIST